MITSETWRVINCKKNEIQRLIKAVNIISVFTTTHSDCYKLGFVSRRISWLRLKGEWGETQWGKRKSAFTSSCEAAEPGWPLPQGQVCAELRLLITPSYSFSAPSAARHDLRPHTAQLMDKLRLRSIPHHKAHTHKQQPRRKMGMMWHSEDATTGRSEHLLFSETQSGGSMFVCSHRNMTDVCYVSLLHLWCQIYVWRNINNRLFAADITSYS